MSVRWGTPWVVLVVAALVSGCLSPSGGRAGLRLSGESAAVPSDWSFADQHREIALEVRSPLRLPHSVTIWCATVDARLYVGARDPESKRWLILRRIG